MILFAGALLLTPGFFTDVLGFALLIPPVRLAAFHWLRRRVRMRGFPMGSAQNQAQADRGEGVIDGEFEELPTGKLPTHQPSGWTRH